MVYILLLCSLFILTPYPSGAHTDYGKFLFEKMENFGFYVMVLISKCPSTGLLTLVNQDESITALQVNLIFTYLRDQTCQTCRSSLDFDLPVIIFGAYLHSHKLVTIYNINWSLIYIGTKRLKFTQI